MSSLTIKRIGNDIRNFNKDNLIGKEGIYCQFNESNMYKLRAFILGNPETPYQYGYYLFDIEFPKNYPISPPSVKFLTNDGRVRVNPNLYKCGKVCLSFLNTWQGPKWTACMNLSSSLRNIQSILHENPINNEPGWENVNLKDRRAKKYNLVLSYFNIKTAIVDNINNCQSEYFKNIMIDYLKKNYNLILKELNNLEKHDNKTIYSNIYNINIKFKVKLLKTNLIKLLKKYIINYEDEKDKTKKLKKKYVRKSPNDSAKNYDVGFIKKSENDQNMWKVILTKNNIKRWVKT